MRTTQSDGRAGGSALTGADDDRITPIGKRMRAFHLDELPQLWNVVRGEMLLIGSRPEAPDFVEDNDPMWARVLMCPPGIAGPTQLVVGEWERASLHLGEQYYRQQLLPVKLAVDAWYLRTASPLVDLFVLASLAGRFSGHAGWRLRRFVAKRVPEVADALHRFPTEDASRS